MTSPFPPQRLAFIGGYGHHLLRGALQDEAVDVEAVAVAPDRQEPAAAKRKFERELAGGATWYDDMARMLDEFEPTAVNIGGVYAHDVPLIIEALKRGLPVVAEKPIAATWADYHALRAATREGDRILLTEFPFRSQAAFRSARQAVRDGRIGTPILATAQKSYRFGDQRPDFYKRREDYGSTLLWVASHGLDAIYFTTGQAFTTAAGHHGNLARPDYGEMEDHCAALYTLANGGTALVHGDLLRPAAAATHGDDRLRIVGSAGLLEVCDGRCRLTTHDQPEREITDHVTPTPTHQEMLHAIRQGGTDLYNTADSLLIAAALLAGRDAADEQRIVSVEDAVCAEMHE